MQTTMKNTTEINSTGRLDTLWKQLSSADRHVILGHSEPVMSPEDRAKFARVVETLGARARAQRTGSSLRPFSNRRGR